jgi:hypothetical protein
MVLAAAGADAQTQAFLEPEEAGTDFKLQGEYYGKLETVTPLGAQVVALGNGQFKAVFLAGGFPGSGGTGERVEVPGSLGGDGTASFAGSGYAAVVAADGGSIAGKTDKGALFNLPKIMRKSPTEGAPPPAGARVLFDGTGLKEWKDGTATIDARKLFKPEGQSASSGAVTNAVFGDFTLHLEFREPFMPAARGQRRGNSGVYLQGRDEVQVLDSFGNTLEFGAGDTMSAKREAGGIFELLRPAINMAFPPLSWQTYDIEWAAARFSADGKTTLAPAIVTVRWNGEAVLDHKTLIYSSLLGDVWGPAPGPLRFQAYGDPVYYRNIWITEGTAAVRPRPEVSPLRQGRAGDGPAPLRNAEGRRMPSRPAFGHYWGTAL